MQKVVLAFMLVCSVVFFVLLNPIHPNLHVDFCAGQDSLHWFVLFSQAPPFLRHLLEKHYRPVQYSYHERPVHGV